MLTNPYASIRHRARNLIFGLLIAASVFLPACRSQGEAIPASNLSHNQVKIEVMEDGFYRLTLDELQEVGLAVNSLASNSLHLSHAGTAVPYFIEEKALIFLVRLLSTNQ